MYVALGIQHAMRMRHIFFCGLSGYRIFFHIFILQDSKKIMNKILLGDIKIFRRFYALRVSSVTASRLFLKLINFILQIKLATLQEK